MNIVVDTSVIIAVVTNEQHKNKLIKATKGCDLIAPSSLHWEIGNAFSAMFKRKQILLKQAVKAINAYYQIPLRFYDVDLTTAIEISENLNIYAYDAYFISCALVYNSPLISLDKRLIKSAKETGVQIREVEI